MMTTASTVRDRQDVPRSLRRVVEPVPPRNHLRSLRRTKSTTTGTRKHFLRPAYLRGSPAEPRQLSGLQQTSQCVVRRLSQPRLSCRRRSPRCIQPIRRNPRRHIPQWNLGKQERHPPRLRHFPPHFIPRLRRVHCQQLLSRRSLPPSSQLPCQVSVLLPTRRQCHPGPPHHIRPCLQVRQVHQR
jgi:hypothetical protein